MKFFKYLFLGFAVACLLLSCTNTGTTQETFSPEKTRIVNYPWEIPAIWQSAGLEKEILYHFSSSIFISEKKTGLFTKWDVLPENVSEVNFIRSLHKSGRLKKTVWVVPYSKFFRDPNKFLLSKGLQRSDYRIRNVQKGSIRCFIKNTPVEIVSLENLPSAKKPVCLNLDPSYFNAVYLNIQRTREISRQIPSPPDILKRLKKKDINLKVATLLSYKHYRGHLMKLRTEFTIPWTETLLSNKESSKYSRYLQSLKYQIQGDYRRSISQIRNMKNSEELLLQKLILALEAGKIDSVSNCFQQLTRENTIYRSLRPRIGEFILNRYSHKEAGNFYKKTETGDSTKSGSNQSATFDSNKNILLITADTFRADIPGCYGNEIIEIPVIDELASKGMVFDNAYSLIPQTAPSHASILTGRYPTTLGTLDNGMALQKKWMTLAEFLKKRGYTTGAIIAGYPLEKSISGLNQGFELYDDEFTRKVKGKYTEKKAKEVTERAVNFLKKNKDSRPYFLWVHYYDPHGPYKPPSSFRSTYKNESGLFGVKKNSNDAYIPKYQRLTGITDPDIYRAAYAGEATYLDKELGRLIDNVNRKNTAVVFTADHGESMGEHSIYFDHGQNLYEENTHVPLIMDLPGIEKSGRFQRVVELTDIAPTLLDWCELKGFECSGVSLLKREESEKKGNVFATTGTVYLRDPKTKQLISLRNEEYKLIYSLQNGSSSLFNLKKDPAERRDISQRFPQLTENLKAELLSWWENTTVLSQTGKKLSEDEKRKLESLGYVSR